MSTRHFVLTNEPLDEQLPAQIISVDGAGGIVSFVGRVRNEARGHEVTLLEYEAYPEMVERVFADIAAEARKQFAITDIAIHHRVGALEVGDVSVVIAVSAPHRGAAFDACHYAIDRLKHIAPIWKKEHTPEGAVWVDDRP
ncbi:MAG: molybdenum cofactor biosynthesis protein MoaE [Candidatus Eremiobacteraeota bacterium]|nr:molybdenum cofactor biosynthesis protein MoaE [Candidatus Eremiobacteraeota bacterium]MBV8365966.1 molybdenum cofactor biosynthesis protein MoaE [Candidatus Eremiobacteraeota bacterium]